MVQKEADLKKTKRGWGWGQRKKGKLGKKEKELPVIGLTNPSPALSFDR